MLPVPAEAAATFDITLGSGSFTGADPVQEVAVVFRLDSKEWELALLDFPKEVFVNEVLLERW